MGNSQVSVYRTIGPTQVYFWPHNRNALCVHMKFPLTLNNDSNFAFIVKSSALMQSYLVDIH